MICSRFRLPDLVLQDDVEIPHPRETSAADVEIWTHDDGRVVAYCAKWGDQYWVDLPEVARFSFARAGRKVTVARHLPIPDDVLIDIYHRSALPLVLQALDVEVVHASGAVLPGGVVGLCGHSGVGKSTTAYGLGRRGHPLWADDALALVISAGAISTYRLPFETRLRPPAASFFGRDTLARGWHGDMEPERAPTECEPLAALCVLVPETGGSDVPTIHRLRPAAAFTRLLAQAYCFSLKDDGDKRRMVDHYLELATRVPVFEMRFGPCLEGLPKVLDAVETIAGSFVPAG